VQVKTNEPRGSGAAEQAWEFRHPHFNRDGYEQLGSIKRKIPSKKSRDESEPKSAEELQAQVDALGHIQKDMANYLQTLSKNYESVVREVVTFKKSIAAQDQLIQNLLQYLVSRDSGKLEDIESQKKLGPPIEAPGGEFSFPLSVWSQPDPFSFPKALRTSPQHRR